MNGKAERERRGGNIFVSRLDDAAFYGLRGLMPRAAWVNFTRAGFAIAQDNRRF
jgi:hypothetical protein